ncbi:MAG: type 4a pilus biogenesis protein PilO [Phycisphaerales bacterium]|jgi:Tfp pilus assembly protein PilO
MNLNIIITWFHEKKQTVVIVTAVVLICVFIFLWFLPLRGKARSMKRQQSQQQAIISNAGNKAIQLPKMNETLNELKSKVSSYDLKIPVQANLGQFLGRIASLMDEHRLTEQMIEPQQEIQTEKLSSIPVTMKCKGRLAQIRAFYQSLQDMDRTVRIEKFKLSNDKDLTGVVTMETEAVIYHRAGNEQS